MINNKKNYLVILLILINIFLLLDKFKYLLSAFIFLDLVSKFEYKTSTSLY